MTEINPNDPKIITRSNLRAFKETLKEEESSSIFMAFWQADKYNEQG